MAESTHSIDRTRLRRIVGRKLRYGRSAAAWTSDQTTDVDDMVNVGLARFYQAHQWSFLKPTLEVPLYAPYSTGTIGVASGVVTLTGGTLPAWAADGDLIYSGVAYEVSVRTSGSAMTLRDTSLTVTAGATYSLISARYTLPHQFGGLEGDHLAYRPGTNTGPQYVWITDPAEIRASRYQTPDYTNPPQAVAVRPKSSDGTDGQRSELLFWPPPATAGMLLGRGRTHPDMLTSVIVYPFGGSDHSYTIIQACLAACIELRPDVIVHEQLYQEALAKSIKRDRDQFSPATIGYDLGCAPQFDNPSAEAGVWPASGLPSPLDI